MSFLEKVYDNSPIFLQNIMCSLEGYRKCRVRYADAYWKHRKFLEDFDNWPLEKQLEYQRTEMVKFIKYAYNNSKFYHNLYQGINIDEIQTVEDLKKLPMVDKEMLRANMSDVVTIDPREGGVGHTGGTTGKSLVVINRKVDSAIRQAILDNFKHRVGFENRVMKRATFNGKHIVPPNQKKPVFWRYNLSCKQMIYSSFNINEDTLQYYVDSLNRYKPDALDGFFTCICEVASFVKRHGLKLEFQPVAIFPTSETLTDSGRQLLEEVFHCPVYNQYASSEGAPFITECCKRRLHMELSSGVFEHPFGDDEIVVTSFFTYGTPLIRYRIGDRVKISDNQSCDCGLKGTIVDYIEGRRLDFLYTPSGSKINAGCVANLLKYAINSVVCAQFIQSEKTSFQIKLVVDKEHFTDKTIDEIREQVVHTFGKEMHVDFSIVDDIPREKSGKRRMIINNVM